MKSLPDSFQSKSREELKTIIEAKAAERAIIQKEIAEASSKRSAFISTANANNTDNKPKTLESVIEEIIKVQAARYNMIVE